MNRLRWVLWLCLAATLVAAWLAPANDESAGVALSSRVTDRRDPAFEQSGGTSQVPALPRDQPFVATHKSTSGSDEPEVLAIRARQKDEDQDPLSDLFASPGWAHKVAPSAPAVSGTTHAPAVAPAPSAPPLPFTVMGSMNDGGQTRYFLRNADQSFVVQVGDTLLDQYRVEAIEGNRLVLRYLPMNQLQSLELGNPS